jgi:hypothetical protein
MTKLRSALLASVMAIPLLAGPASAQNKIAFTSAFPRTLVFIQEKGDGTRNGATATNHVSDYLRQAGFPLIDPEIAQTAAQKELVAAALKGDEQAAVSLGRDFGAQVIILGTADWGTAPNPGLDKTLVGTAEVDLRALRLDAGTVVGQAKRGTGRGLDATEQMARSKAIHDALDKILNQSEFVGAIANNWTEVAWSPKNYFPVDPGSVGAGVSGAPTSAPKLAIIRTDVLPPLGAGTATRGIGVMKKADPNSGVKNDVDIEGVVVGNVSSVLVEGTQAKLTLLDAEEKTKLGVSGVASRFLARISLPQSQDTVNVTATGTDGQKVSTRAAPRIGQRWAVVIGVSDYRSDDIRDLAYASKDAQSVYDFLTSSAAGPFPDDHVMFLKDGQATAQAIREALFVFLQKAQWNDLVVVYFAGHGAADPALPGNLYLLPTDADIKALASTGFPMWDVKVALRRQIRAERVIVIADACHSGGAAGDENPISGSFSELFTPSRRLTLTAASDNEQSLEDTKWGGGHGVFTYQLLEALKGAGDADGNGIVTFNEAADYVGKRVKAETGSRQNPQRSGLGDIPLAEASKAGAASTPGK